MTLASLILQLTLIVISVIGKVATALGIVFILKCAMNGARAAWQLLVRKWETTLAGKHAIS